MVEKENKEEKKEESLKKSEGSRKIWWIVGCLGCVSLFVAFSLLFTSCVAFPALFGYLITKKSSLSVRCENVTAFVGDEFEFTVEIRNRSRRRIKISQVDFEESKIGKGFSITKIEPPSVGEEFTEEFEDVPATMTFYYDPPLELKPREVQKLKVKGEAFKEGYYIINVLVCEKTPFGEVAGPYNSSICRLMIKAQKEE